MILEQIFPTPEPATLIDSDELSVLYPKIQGIRYNFVVANGIKLDTSSDTSSNKLDRELLKFIRSQSDLIITTGKTARSENLSASKYAPLLILTRSSEDSDIRAVNSNEGKPVYITQRLGTVHSSDKSIAIGGVSGDLPVFVDSFLRANNFNNPVLESGMETAKLFASAGTIKEVNVTLTRFNSRAEAEASALDFLENLGVNGTLVQILNSDDTWFFRFSASQSID